MAAGGKVIKNKIKSVGNIKKITRTMEMVSVAKMRRAVDRSRRSQRFTMHAYEILAVASREQHITHPLMETPKGGTKHLVVIVGSNKGLAGGYNINLAKKLRGVLIETPQCEVIAIGKQAERIARRFKCPIIASFTDFSETPQVEQVRSLQSLVRDEYLTGAYARVSVITTLFIKAMQYEAVVVPLLPLSKDLGHFLPPETRQRVEERGHSALYLYEPTINRLADVVLPKLLLSLLYQMVLEAAAAEHSSRMVAMKNASDNASSLMDDLVLSFNKARQAAITQELSEIVGGANALHYS